MQFELPRSGRKRLIGMTPLIDVVFILLLFFMLASNFQQWRALPLELNGNRSNITDPVSLFSIHVGAEGQLTLDGEPITPVLLAALLATQLNEGLAPRVVVESDPATELQTLVQVIDQLAALGIEQITLGGAHR